MGRPAIAFDIESVGCEWEDLDAPTQDYLVVRSRRRRVREGLPAEGSEEYARDTLSLSPGTGRIVAICMVHMSTGQGAMLYEGRGGWVDTEPGETRIFRGDEEAMLREFWILLERFGRVITYNGRGFDIPFAYLRSALHGIKPSRSLLGNRFAIGEHCDLAEVLTFFGAAQERFSLDYWCRRFDIESPKEEGIDGSQVAGLYHEGRIDDIAEYCLRDARATGELYRCLEKTLVELYLKR